MLKCILLKIQFSLVWLNECHVIHLKRYPYSMKQIDPKRQPTQTKILTCFFLSWTSLLNLTLCKCLENEKFRSLSNLRLSLNKRHRFIFTIPPLKMLLLFFEWWLITSPSQLQKRYPPFQGVCLLNRNYFRHPFEKP